RGKGRVNDAGPLPDFHVFPPSLALHIGAQIAVRQEENRLFGRNGVDDLNRVPRGAEDIAFRLHLDGGVDVTHNHVAWVSPPDRPYWLNGTGVHQAACGLAVGYDDNAVRVQNLGRLRHEPYAAKSNHAAFEVTRPARQFQTVTDDIRQFLDLRLLIMMGQKDGLPLLF